jgi:hypothetical protein
MKFENYNFLCFTNLLLLYSIFYFFYNNKKYILFEYILVSLLPFTVICSQLFWINPIRNSLIHSIDAFIAKIVISSFIIYTLIYKYNFSYIILLYFIFLSFYYSNYYSSKKWCCNNHLFFHGLLHIFCFIATFYAFA